jgi:hypothetical protein
LNFNLFKPAAYLEKVTKVFFLHFQIHGIEKVFIQKSQNNKKCLKAAIKSNKVEKSLFFVSEISLNVKKRI